MYAFELDPESTEAELSRARADASHTDLTVLLDRARQGGGLDAYDLAVLWHASSLRTDAAYELAATVRSRRHSPLETFSPLYLTNTCDAECKMCGMRRGNKLINRVTVDHKAIVEQLEILRQRGMLGVALLTGEYRAQQRAWAIDFVNEALLATQRLGFRHVLINIGSLEVDELDTLLTGVERDGEGRIVPKVTMCTFQESYSPDVYTKFMGSDPSNPRADFQRRLRNFDRAYAAGMRVANPGILLGINADVGYELFALARHAEHLLALGMDVYLSVPRLRQTAGDDTQGGIGDEEFTRLVALLALGLPRCKIVITTRESPEIQHRLSPLVDVISAGSSAVAPYTESGARFPLQESQFEVIDQRPFETVLRDFQAAGPIECFEPDDRRQ